jgi:hypothetical protein
MGQNGHSLKISMTTARQLAFHTAPECRTPRSAEVAEKLIKLGSMNEKHPSGAEARTHFAGFIGTDESVPLQNNGRISKQRIETLDLKPDLPVVP